MRSCEVSCAFVDGGDNDGRQSQAESRARRPSVPATTSHWHPSACSYMLSSAQIPTASSPIMFTVVTYY